MRARTAIAGLVLAGGLLGVASAAASPSVPAKRAHSSTASTRSSGPSASFASGTGGAGLAASPPGAPRPAARAHRRPRIARGTVHVKRATGGDSRHLGDRVLRQGMRGHDVRVLQAYLTLVGYPTAVDGDFGPSTLTTLIAFQTAAGFAPNGVVTVPVEKALRARVKVNEADPPAGRTRINPDGTATAPAGAPQVVQAVVQAANEIIDTPYQYGGGHASFKDSGYDCSGAVSFALHGGGLLSSPEDSVELESYGSPGPGHWITIYANSAHAWIVVAGRAFDTADFGGPNLPSGTGPRWRSDPLGNLNDGTGAYVVRHPTGL